MPVEPPTAEEWEKHRKLIADLYTRRTLKVIRAHLKDVHGFNATETHGQTPPGFPSALKPPLASPYPIDTGVDSRSTTYVGTPGPASFPPTPVSTLGYRSPTVYESEDINVDPDVLCIEIVNIAISILSRLVQERPVGTGFEGCTPTEDHITIYRTLQEDLKHESYIRGCLVNNTSAAPTSSLGERVKDLLKSYHPAMPIGLLSAVNQCMDHNTIQELVFCLTSSSAAVLPRDDDFIHLAHRLRRLLAITSFEKFQQFMEQICQSLESEVVKVLGRRSLVTIYLMFLLSAKKAKRERKPDNKILTMALESMAHVQHAYQDDPKLIMQFSLFITGYCALAGPEGKFDRGVLDMAEDCCDRAEKYLIKLESTDGSKQADIRDAKSHYGKSCSLLADCRYAQGNESYVEHREELHRSSRRLLMLAIACHVDCSLGTMAQFERHKQKLERWCHDANDTPRLQQLKVVENLITEYKQRPKDGPLVPRLPVLQLIEGTTENASPRLGDGGGFLNRQLVATKITP
ncbi:uncharacterized protein LY79DRAFT_523964 [Colletotrichum navitas]|uniref:Clr5 domain-containing protein n=1 Tax=Colletotrichum navitas TaxID=681940 RepID=A0AAD8PRM5_9PEZI|nr:uncharacterized protein LY79DRAFT_523964 [Colletotrichum navitas]KAK1574414.1 hypothetical protein LY79DRAFT_523964 [Colletotrichum navitas]